MRKVMFALAMVAGALMTIAPADAIQLKCGSSWEICAQRGNGPGSKFDPAKTVRGNQRQIREGFDRK
jgi:hypothetical protein